MKKMNDEGTLHDLMAAKAEAKGKMRELTDDELTQVSGGGAGFKNCVACGAWISASYKKCPVCHEWAGDKRDMNEDMADIDGLMADIDGFAE